MEFKDYQNQATRTCANLSSAELDLAHMALGINSEISELASSTDDVNVAEEVADIMWYVANYYTFKNDIRFDFELECNRVLNYRIHNSFLDLNATEKINHLYYLSSELSDIVKKKIAYNKEVSFNEENSILVSIIILCFQIIIDSKHDVKTSLAKNIAKLKVRYPEKFTTENAINRDLISEREVLESKL